MKINFRTVLFYGIVLFVITMYVQAIDRSAKTYTPSVSVTLQPLNQEIPKVAGMLKIYYRNENGPQSHPWIIARGDKIVESDSVSPNYTEFHNSWGQYYVVYTVPVGQVDEYIQIR